MRGKEAYSGAFPYFSLPSSLEWAKWKSANDIGIAALPLWTWGNIPIEAMALLFNGSVRLTRRIVELSDYGSALLADLLREQSDSAKPRVMDERISRLKMSPAQRRRALEPLISESACMRRTCGLIASVASEEFPILITGETGTGK